MPKKETFTIQQKTQLARILARELRILIKQLLKPKKIKSHLQLCIILREAYERALADAQEYEGVAEQDIVLKIQRRRQMLLKGSRK